MPTDRFHSRSFRALAFSLIASGCTRHPDATPKPQTPEGTGSARSSALAESLDTEALQATATTLSSAVTKVTVYSDRARVTREATATAETEPTVFAFRELPGWVDDGSVRVAASTGRIVDVRVVRDFLARATDASVLKAEADHQALTSRLAALQDELLVLDAQKLQIESIKAFSLEKITKDTTIGNVSVKSYEEVLGFITEALRKTAKARRAAQLALDKLNPEVQASLLNLNEKKSLLQLEETTVLVTLQGDGAAPSTLELTYMLPGATWEPMHEVRATTGDSKGVEVVSFASVTQTSGEDWGKAELSFSTQSSVQSVRIPELEALTLGDTHTATRILTSQVSSFARAQEAFAGQSTLWNKVHDKSTSRERASFEEVYKHNMEYLQVVQGKTVQIFESLEKRGTTAHFKANVAPSVRGDGHPVRMLIGRGTFESTQRIVAAPEQSLNAVSTLQMVNSTGQSLLPGKVALYQDGAFVGMTELDFIAEGEDFSVFLSVADHLKLSRKLDKKRSAIVRKKRTSMQLSFIVTVENLSSKATTLSLTDRIPVSENKDIKVDRIDINPATKPDSRGLLHWQVALAPKETRQYRISYQIEYPEELLVEPRRKRLEAPSAAPKRRLDASDPYGIEDQIMDLEEQL
jgi:uncharacterized protein (TIGR02231 family)